MKLLFLLSPIILVLYLLLVRKKYGKTKSISETYRVLPEKGKAWFSIGLLGYLVPLLMAAPDRIFILAGIMLALVASNPVYWVKEGLQDDMHYIGSYGVILLGYAGLIMTNFVVGLCVFLLFAVFVVGLELNFKFLAKVKNDTYWQEVAAALSIPITLYFIY